MKSAATLLLRVAVVALASSIGSLAAWAQADPPGRVGRIADLQGNVSVYDHEQGQWEPALRNRPLTQGDRVATDGNARGELRIGSSTLRLGSGSEIEVLRLDDERVAVQLHSGELALRIRSRDVAAETEVITAEARLLALRSGHFRIDRIDDSTYVGIWRGELRVVADDNAGDEGLVINDGRRVELWREGPRRELRHGWAMAADDDFARWVLREDRGDERTASSRYVSPEMTGAEDLDRNGRWEQNPDYGAVWVPALVQADWAPYRYGRWVWLPPWGWTWVDDAPWGFAPFHYGRWISLSGRWCWTPGAYVARPVYAPALVAWIGAPRGGMSAGMGGPTVGWVPLAPREVFVPWYRASPGYGHRVNHEPPVRERPPMRVPAGPIVYRNQGVPGAVTVVPRDVLVQRQPVARAVVDVHESLQQAPPPAPMGLAPAVPATTAAPAFPGRPALRPKVDVERPRAPLETPQPVLRVPAPAAPQASPQLPPAAVELRHAPAAVQQPAPPPLSHAATQPVPLSPALPQTLAKPRPPEPHEAPKDDNHPRTPESRNNMREREQQR